MKITVSSTRINLEFPVLAWLGIPKKCIGIYSQFRIHGMHISYYMKCLTFPRYSIGHNFVHISCGQYT